MATSIIFYILMFLSIYGQVFLLLTFIERRREIPCRKNSISLKKFPSVAIIVPCYNEEETIKETAESVLALEYPKDKLELYLVNDGSTDRTLEIMQEYKDHPQVHLLSKENGGKHTAMNLALDHIDTDLVGSLDADSFVTQYSLERIVAVFNNDLETMSVVSSILIHKPKNLLQLAQKAEYEMSVYIKNMLALVGGLHVTPGPLSVFRRSVFDTLGKYKEAHNTEDIEIALRMQRHHYKITYCADSYIYTVAPDTVLKFFRQRVRWTYGFLKNVIDYKDLLFRRSYGNLSFFTLPFGIISFFLVLSVSVLTIVRIVQVLHGKVEQLSVAGVDSVLAFDWFNIELGGVLFLLAILYGTVIFTLIVGRKMSQQKLGSIKDFLSFMVVSGTIAPVWMFKSMFDTIWSKKRKWK